MHPVAPLHRRRLLAALPALALAPSLAPSLAPALASAADDDANDLMPAFWHAYDAGRHLDSAQRVPQLLERFFAPHAGVYERAGFRPLSADGVQRWLPAFDAIALAVRTLHRRFARDYARHLQRFQHAFSDFDAGASPVLLMPSLFHFDAHLEPVGRTLPLYFGADGIVHFHGADADLGVLMAHEIFHCYQAQKNAALSLDAKPPVYAALWIEGTATYVSERLNTQAALRHVLLDDDALLRGGPAAMPRVVAALIARLDSTEEADLNAFFSAGWKGEWPARAGYYVGLLAARRIGEALSPAEMAALPADEVRRRLAAVLPTLQRPTAFAGARA